jgi:hypothetical protein
MKLEILILTIPARKLFLSQLLSILEPQISALPLRKFDNVDVRIEGEHTDIPVGDRRELVRRKAAGEYIVWIDDDDLISPSYISSILPLLDGVDQVGFRLQGYHNGKIMKPTYHTIKNGDWYDDLSGFYRDISHVCPMRRELALESPMSGGEGEDWRWANAMRGKVKTENYIPQCMYYYLWRDPKKDSADAEDPSRLVLLETLKSIGPR